MAEAPALPSAEELFCFTVYSTAHALNRAYKPLLDELGLTYPQFLVLIALWQKDARTVGGLGAVMHLDSSTLTPLLKRMEVQNLVRRARNAENERQVIVSLTSAGTALRARARDILPVIGCATGLAPDALEALRRQLGGVRDALDASTA